MGLESEIFLIIKSCKLRKKNYARTVDPNKEKFSHCYLNFISPPTIFKILFKNYFYLFPLHLFNPKSMKNYFFLCQISLQDKIRKLTKLLHIISSFSPSVSITPFFCYLFLSRAHNISLDINCINVPSMKREISSLFTKKFSLMRYYLCLFVEYIQ